MNEKHNDGGPAYPVASELALHAGHPGMSMRQHYAGLAMQGILVAGELSRVDALFTSEVLRRIVVVSSVAFKLADAMIKQENE